MTDSLVRGDELRDVLELNWEARVVANRNARLRLEIWAGRGIVPSPTGTKDTLKVVLRSPGKSIVHLWARGEDANDIALARSFTALIAAASTDAERSLWAMIAAAHLRQWALLDSDD